MTRTLRALLLIAPLLISSLAQAQSLDEDEQRLVEWIDGHTSDQLEFFEEVVNINSGTMNPEGVKEVGRLYGEAFEELGMDITWVDLTEVDRAGHLFAESKGSSGRKLLLIGHLDTVFESDSEFQRWEVVSDSIVRGPGTEDMKGGNTVILYALKALHAAGLLADTKIIVALTGDEEYAGRPISTSRHTLIEAARRSDIALGFEGGVGHTHTATVARRSSTNWELTVTGKRGHSSLIFRPEFGAGAIFEASRILNGWYEELTGEENLTFGAGIVVGGTTVSYDGKLNSGTAFGKTNVIPQTVTVAGDLRTLSPEQDARARERMQAIVDQHLPQTSATLEFDEGYPPMAPTEGNFALFEQLNQVSLDLGYPAIEVIEPGRRGAADISFVAPYVDGLAGLGPYGEGGHTLHEVVDIRSMPVVTKRAAVLIYRLTRDSGI